MNSTTLPKSAWLELPETVVVPLEVGRAILQVEKSMNESECLAKMVAPGTRRKGKYRDGVIQIHITRSCDKSCYNCTQGSNLGGRTSFISLLQFEQAVLSLKGYYGVVGVFGGNPALHPQFEGLCAILTEHIPFEQRGLWCNNPVGKTAIMRKTFDPSVSNLNVHLDSAAYEDFVTGWPECKPVGLHQDSRHSPCYVAMKDVLKVKRVVHADGGDCHGTPLVNGKCPKCGIHPDMQSTGIWPFYDIDRAHELISNCDINQHWSAMMGVFRGELRAWFCEIAGAQAMLHQWEPDYPDTGLLVAPNRSYAIDTTTEANKEWRTCRPGQWWELPMEEFAHQVRKHCHDCGVPLRGFGELAQMNNDVGVEQVSATHEGIYRPKRKGRRVELVLVPKQLGERLPSTINYLGNSKL